MKFFGVCFDVCKRMCEERKTMYYFFTLFFLQSRGEIPLYVTFVSMWRVVRERPAQAEALERLNAIYWGFVVVLRLCCIVFGLQFFLPLFPLFFFLLLRSLLVAYILWRFRVTWLLLLAYILFIMVSLSSLRSSIIQYVKKKNHIID